MSQLSGWTVPSRPFLLLHVPAVGKFFISSPTTSNVAPTQKVHTPGPDGVKTEANPWLLPPTEVFASWPLDLTLDMHVYLSTSPHGDVFSKGTLSSRRDLEADLPHFVWENITYGNYSESRVESYDIKFPDVCYTISHPPISDRLPS